MSGKIPSRRNSAPFVVVAMFTKDYRDYAERLADSLRALGLTFCLYPVPSVHRSISAKGTEDIAFCKPSFILRALDDFQRPVLYVDVDMVFASMPEIVFRLAQSADFAVYNWLADPCTDGYLAVNGNRDLLRFVWSIDRYDPSQLFCSGGVQFYNDSASARSLLAQWRETIRRWPAAEDDGSLAYTYNFIAHRDGLNSVWLTKDYLRLPWWIYIKPVINHPESPCTSVPMTFETVARTARYRIDRAKILPSQGPFPRDCLIDVRRKLLLRPTGTEAPPIPVGRITTELWL
jgi:hypothetical protein